MNLNLKDRESEAYGAVSEALQDLNIRVDDENGLPVRLLEVKDPGVTLRIADGEAEILYQNRSALFRGVSLLLRAMNRAGGKDALSGSALDLHEEPAFDTLAFMTDCSRNSALNVPTVKRLIRLAALLGYNAVMLYTEDTYEVENEPYFGHLRGRYTAEELKEIDRYAARFGLELIPCIETLAHLDAIFQWPEYQGRSDTANILNTALEENYTLIGRCLDAVSMNIKSRKINVGMDEAYLLGRGKYLEAKGYRDSTKIMLDHLNRIMEMLRARGYEPRMWSDMFFRMATPSRTYYDPEFRFTEELKSIVPAEMVLTYWDYYGLDEAHYERMIRDHLRLSDKIAFAGGDSGWYGLVPLNRFSLLAARPALKSLRKFGIREVTLTLWGDNGSICSRFATLPTFALYGEANWSGKTDDDTLREVLKACAKVDFDAFMRISDLEEPLPGEADPATRKNPTRYLFYQDPLQGKFDAHVPQGANAFYASEAARIRLENESGAAGEFTYLFDSFSALAEVLSLKSELGLHLKAAYDAEDRAALRNLIEETVPAVKSRVEAFRKAYRRQWMTENKPFGFDVQDIRLGGLLMRLQETRETVEDYLAGRIAKIEELEAPRLPYSRKKEPGKPIFLNSWKAFVTGGLIN